MPSYLNKIKKLMGAGAEQQARRMLEGNFGTVLKGRSLDFDDLRSYDYGDDVKDIDWKASARSRQVMIRRYIAVRKHNILIVADNGNSMAALAPSGEQKSEVATFAAATMAYIAKKHGDLVGMVYGNRNNNSHYAPKENLGYIEDFLNKYAQSVNTLSPQSDINALLNYIAKAFRERLFLVVITDPTSAESISSSIVRKLGVRHEQFYILIEDSPLSNPKLAEQDCCDISGRARLPRYLRTSKQVARAENDYLEKQRESIRRNLRRNGAFCCYVRESAQAIRPILKMLEEQKHERH